MVLIPVRFVRPDSDMASIWVEDGVGEGERRGIVSRLDDVWELTGGLALELADVLPKKRTMNVNSADALSSNTKLTERKIASTGTACLTCQYRASLVLETDLETFPRHLMVS